MTRMLDVLEQFLNYHGHIYLRLDGSTRVEQRQSLMERFNADRRIFCFILSTRSGGVGVNLTGADTVVFYDSDWNPTMDAQAQDRCHRIGQTRDVHIYRLISERTVEENILKKANQKRLLGDMAIDGGNFTTAFFKEQTIRELFDVNEGEKREAATEVTVAPPIEDEESASKQSTTILEQLTPIERYAMNFLEASLEDVCKEELKQAEEQVEAARKGLDQAKEEGLKHNASSDDDDMSSPLASAETPVATPARRGRKPKDKSAASTRVSGRLRGASPEPEPAPREVPERPRSLRGRPPSKFSSSTSSSAATPPSTATPTRTDPHNTKSSSSSASSSKDSEDSNDQDSVVLVLPACSRLPRKRQSADGEVLRGLSDDSPSAKVLRKLPGRLVTVVTEKEPRKRRRRASGTCGHGASEEEQAGGSAHEPSRDSAPQSPPDHKPKGLPCNKSALDKDSGPALPTPPPPQPVRGYPPYSPPHLSPDMPVLRNLPVRRRLETESRMAAQLSEQLGRGQGAGQPHKTDTPLGQEPTATGVEPGENSVVVPAAAVPVKRKRGRPPKTPPLKVEISPTMSPKRKRGRPRKDASAMPDYARREPNNDIAAVAGPLAKTASAQKPVDGGSDSKRSASSQPHPSDKPHPPARSCRMSAPNTCVGSTSTSTP
ncbi:hypothetical protein CRUP_023275 [Coryphaenoides rupestris]|nr:hypothetical protein CRUP_023275 [Coryphaenoides rupestris]